MPPVEQTSVPREPERRKSVTELKVVEKAKEIPVVSDTLSQLGKVGNTLSEYAHVMTAKKMVEDGIKILTDNPRVKGGIRVINENATIQQAVSSVRDRVYPRVANAVDQLDTMACGGIDSLTTALPSLNAPTPDLVESTKETARNYFSLSTEYMASFTVSRLSLSAVDYSLGMAEKSVKFFKPDEKDCGVLCKTYTKIRKARRTLRALRRAGERRSHIESDKLSRAGLAGRVCSFMSVNFFLHMVGLEMVTFRKRRSDNIDGPNNEVSTAELKELQDLEGYRSEEDPDYCPDSDDTLDGSDSEDTECEDNGSQNAPREDVNEQ